MASASSLRRPPSALFAGASGGGNARRCRAPRPVVAISARRPFLAPPRASATPGGSGSSDDLPDRNLPPSSFPDLFGTDDPPTGPKAMAALLAELAAASTAAELQAALLSFLPRHMLEDAEEDDADAEQQQQPRDWGAQWRAMTAAAGDQQKQPPPPENQGAAPETPPSPPPPPPPSLPRALELMLRRPADEQPLDSFALRHLVLTRPRALEPLSAFSASASRYVQRVAVLGATGERAVLTFTLARRGAGRRARRHAATAPTSGSAAAHWFLVRVEGEQQGGSADDAAAASSSSSSELAPETVVALQLERLRRGDVDGAFSLTSPVGRAVAGDLPRFRHLLSSDARFKPLLKHGGWASLRRTQSIARSYVEVVAVRPAGGAEGGKGGGTKAKAQQQPQEGEGEEEEAVYAVIASLHPAADEKNNDDKAGGERWLIDYFAPIRDKALLRTLLMGAARPTAD